MTTEPSTPREDGELVERLRDSVTLEYSRAISERDKIDETTLGDEAATRIEQLLQDRERIEARLAAVRHVIESGYRGVDKADKCSHGRYGFEDCIACYDEALIAALEGRTLSTLQSGGGDG